MSTQLWQLTATEIVGQTRSGKLSVQDYAKSLLDRIADRDATVKAWAYLDKDLVLASAKALDQIPSDKRGPLHGVAVAVKDVIYTKDMPTQHKSVLYKDCLVPVDAACVAALRAAGALIFGKTTTTEFAATTLGGPSCNPHDPTRTPGGSSSGSGAAVGDFQVPVALGTQTVGSTIRPGSYNGILAMKPTWGAVSREGLKLYSIMLDTLGLYARSVQDLKLLADVFDMQDDAPIPREPFKVKGARIAAAKTHVWHKAQPGLVGAWNKSLQILKSAGADVHEIALPAEFAQLELWHKIVLHSEGRSAFWGDYCRGKEHLDDFICEQAENRLGWTKQQLTDAYDGLSVLRRQFDQIAAQYDAVLVPSVPDEAPVGITATGFADFCGPWTILHTPVVQLPGFKGSNGMPIGLSLTAPRFHDQHLLYVAEPISHIFAQEGGWKHPVCFSRPIRRYHRGVALSGLSWLRQSSSLQTNDGSVDLTAFYEGLHRIDQAPLLPVNVSHDPPIISSANYLSQLADIEQTLTDIESEAGGSKTIVPLPVSSAEWTHLLDTCIQAGDENALFETLYLMRRGRAALTIDVFASAIKTCSNALVPDLAVKLLNLAEHWSLASVELHTLVIQSYLLVGNIVAAQRHLDAMQQQAIIPAEDAFRALIQAHGRTENKDLAWQTFYNMRLKAYAIPTIETYNTMLHICAEGHPVMTEQATDLLIELREHGLVANMDTYSHLIRACMRSIHKTTELDLYGQGLRYLQEALQAGLQPDGQTVVAVLEGTKRKGDLARALWLVRKVASTSEDVSPAIMAALFDTYAAYRVPVHQKPKSISVEQNIEILPSSADTKSIHASRIDQQDDLPATHAQALQQIQVLGSQVLGLDDTAQTVLFGRVLPAPNHPLPRFAPKRRLLHAFMLAYGMHADFASTVAIYHHLFKCVDMSPTTASIRIIIEACVRPADSRKGYTLAKQFFEQYLAMPSSGNINDQRIWVAMIQIAARVSEIGEALQLVRDFGSRYPPEQLVRHALARRKSRQAKMSQIPGLTNAVFDTTSSFYDQPSLDFRDLRLLLTRLAEAEQADQISDVRGLLLRYRRAKQEAQVIGQMPRTSNP